MPLPEPIFARVGEPAIPIVLVKKAVADTWLAAQRPAVQTWARQTGWSGQLGNPLILQAADGSVSGVALGYGTGADRARKRFGVLANIATLPKATYTLTGDATDREKTAFTLGWALSQYHFDRYKSKAVDGPKLVPPSGVDVPRTSAVATGEALTRDLINTPSSDMGPDELEAVTRALADVHGARITVTKGDALLSQNFPMIHAVGRASTRAPRLIDMSWGMAGPALTLVGKGVCFDTGGLNIKPASSMGLMKKDMGGAAHVLGLAQMIMATKMPVRLRVLIPAVENSIDGNAFRPQDVLTSRKGLTVEINNTDAEGRLVLADALALADESPPDLMICMATLTGAARVAVGPDIAPYYTDDPLVSHAITQAGQDVLDPVWQMPFHDPYEAMIEPDIADLDNAPKGGFAGSITAALFLRRFVTQTARFVHFDCYGWQPASAPTRPKGGVGQGTRALFDALPKVLNL